MRMLIKEKNDICFWILVVRLLWFCMMSWWWSFHGGLLRFQWFYWCAQNVGWRLWLCGMCIELVVERDEWCILMDINVVVIMDRCQS